MAANAKYRRLTYDTAPLFAVPLAQCYSGEATLHLRTVGDPMALAGSVEQIVHSLNANLPIYNVTTLEDNVRVSSVFERLAVMLAGSFGVIALLLSAIGIYGVVSYSSRQRMHEMGIRIALGADRMILFRNILAWGLRLSAAGSLIGVVSSLLLTRFLHGVLYGIGATDWMTLTVVVCLLTAVSLFACCVPAWRAAHVDPIVALHNE